MKLKKNKKGFTLVELLVVIAIIGILAVVAVPALFSNINKAKVASVESDYSSIKSSALSYYSDTNKMPVKENGDLSELSTYMETLPSKADIGGEYKLLLVNKKLVLQIGDKDGGATLTKAQSAKLLSDLGKNKIYKEADLNDTNELKKDDEINNKNLYIVLIDNADMDSATA
ncbi:type II secretion system protein [Clostridioides difficile]|uniref:type II secretion system protein n=1 Tax=Clostridioides difficile TaxID=1496 RepID=UPI0021C9DB5F|nr:prepilin-type N-terminal cleavage/methylation domain-containing protein [Clostridioides difficile]UUV15289.1 prepilin-type N-terminal cleavage/methylation domain-containing protein [Clostridioides difficile]